MSWLDDVRAAFQDRKAAPAHPADPFDPARSGTSRGYAQAALDGETQKVLAAQNGTRNHTLNAAAFSLAQLIAGGDLDEQTVVDELTAAARLVGLDEAEIGPTIRSGLAAGARHPRSTPVRGQVPDRSGQPAEAPDSGDLSAAVHEHLPRLDWRALWADEDPEEWIVEPILPARRLVALYSAPKVGKSLLMLEIAVAVARGETVLGTVPDRPRRVLYVDFENDPRGDVRERLVAMGYGPEHLDDLVYLSYPRLAALDSAQGGQQLLAAVRTYGCEVVVIDTVSRAIKGEENENDTWLAFYRHTGRELKAAGVALIRLDHSGKDETRGQRGGSAKSGDVDAVWRMSKLSETTLQLVCEAHRMPVLEKTLVLHRETSPRLRHRVDAAGRSATWRLKVDEAVKVLDAAGLDPSAGRERAREVLRQASLKISNEVLSEVIRQRKTTIGIDPDLSADSSGQPRTGDLSAIPSGQVRTGGFGS